MRGGGEPGHVDDDLGNILLISRDAAQADVQALHTYEGTKTVQTSSSSDITDDRAFA